MRRRSANGDSAPAAAAARWSSSRCRRASAAASSPKAIIYHGRRGLAAEIGHMTITGEGDRCFCGVVGCFEAVASGTALGRRATAADGDRATAHCSGGFRPMATFRRGMSSRPRAPETCSALELVDAEANWLGIGFTNLLHLYSPDLIVMGGGLANGFDLLAPTIRAVVAAAGHAGLPRRADRVSAAWRPGRPDRRRQPDPLGGRARRTAGDGVG